MTAQEFETLIEDINNNESAERRGKYIENSMDFEVAEVEVVTSLN